MSSVNSAGCDQAKPSSEEEISLLLCTVDITALFVSGCVGPIRRINQCCAVAVSLLFSSLSLLRVVNANEVEQHEKQNTATHPAPV